MSKKKSAALASKLRFPEFANSSVVDFKNGNVIFEPINNKDHNSDLPVLAITQDRGAFPREMMDYNVFVSDKSLDNYKIVEIGDFIISLRSFQGGIEYSLFRGICSPVYIILRKKVDIVEQYYKYYFKTNKFIQDLNRNLEGIRDGKMVSYAQFSAILLPKPCNKEQQKIADCLSSFNDLINAEDKKLALLKAHKKALMQKLFPAEGKTIPELRFPEFRDCGEWKRSELGAIFDNRQEIGFVSLPLMSLTDEYGIIPQAETNKKDNSNSDKSKYLRICIGDVVYNTMRMWQGRCAHVNSEGIVSPAYTVCTPKNEYVGLFFNYYFKTTNLIRKFHINSQGLVNDTLNLKYDIFSKILIIFPSFVEQQKITEFLSSIDNLTTAQAEKIAILKSHKKGLMQGLFPSIEEVGG